MVGATGERFTLKTDDEGYAYKALEFTASDVVIWTAKNTSKTEKLHFSVHSKGSGWCGTMVPAFSAVLKPGETVTGSKLGKDFASKTAHFSLEGEGEVELQVK
jgi:hypothetical protein